MFVVLDVTGFAVAWVVDEAIAAEDDDEAMAALAATEHATATAGQRGVPTSRRKPSDPELTSGVAAALAKLRQNS